MYLPIIFKILEISSIQDDEFCTALVEEETDILFSDVCTNEEEKLWECGIIPYIFNDNVSEELKDIIKEAMKRIAKVSIIRFIEITDKSDYIKIIDGGRFASYVGRKEGKQVQIY